MGDNTKLIICPKCVNDLREVPARTYMQYRGFLIYVKIPENRICQKCNTQLVETKMPREDAVVLSKINNDTNFLESMISLAENDPVEYQLKMSQFRENLAQAKAVEEQSKPHCPHCKSTNIKPLSALNRGTSITVWGIFSKKINKSFECMDCKYTW